MNRRPSVSVNAAGTLVMSGMYGSCAASRTRGRSASTNGRSLNGPAGSAGTVNPSLTRPVSPQSARGRGRVVQDVVATVHGRAGGQGWAAQDAEDPMAVDPCQPRPGAVVVGDRATRSVGRQAEPVGRAGKRLSGGAHRRHGPFAAVE